MNSNTAVRGTFLLPATLAILGLGLRFLGLPLVSLDMQTYLIGWYEAIATRGLAVLREPFSNYTPPYLYLMALTTLTARFLPKVIAIKLISILFDILNALLAYRILKLVRPRGSPALLGAAGFLLIPTLFINSGWWGQADSIYTFFLLLCVYWLMQSRPLPAMLALGLSFSFKAQAAFLAPLILLLVLRKKIPWSYLLLIPAVYLLLMLPAALAGRPLADLLTIYLGQAGDFRELSKNAPNLYEFFPNSLYSPMVMIGIIITIIIILLWAGTYRHRIAEFQPRILLLCALASVVLVPFFLPKMHDRYFYPADVLSYLLAFSGPGLWLPALGYQVISGMVYFVFLSGIHPDRGHLLVQVAAVLNTALVIWILLQQYRLSSQRHDTSADPLAMDHI
jgi:Gpi18-like mannosyltransferase